MSNLRLFQIQADTYTAGLVFDVKTRRCVEAAPRIWWAVGKTFERVKRYCEYRKFKFIKVEEQHG